MSYSPVPESLDVPLTYRMGWLNCIFSLSKDIPTEPCALSHWLGVAAECVSEIAKDPATPDQPWACHCLLAHALAQSTGQSLFNSFQLINHRITLRREDERRAA